MMSSDLMQYDEMVQRHEAAYAAFKQIYTSKNPPPVLRSVNVSWWDLAALGALVLASIAVSGSRTIPEFGGGFIGWAAFIMLEVAMIAYAYWRAEEAGRKEDAKPPTHNLTVLGIGMSFTVILSANLHHTLLDQGLWIPPWVNTTIYVALAISAPALALIAGDRFGSRVVLMGTLRKDARDEYEVNFALWQSGLNKSWDSNKSRWGVRVEIREEALPVLSSAPVLSEQTDSRQSLPAPSGFSRTPDGQRRVMEYLDTHPEDVTMPSRPLAKKIEEATGVSVGHDTANKGRNAWRDQQTEKGQS